jgi:uncharacterized protein (DUF2062 family)
VKSPALIWRTKFRDPLLALLKQGMSAEKLAETVAAGFVCSMFPILGTTSLLNLAVGIRMKLNHPLMQAMNQVLGPVHVAMIIAYVRIGEWIWRMHDDPFTIRDVIETFKNASWSEFFGQFGWATVHAITAWAVTAPIYFVIIFLPFRHVFRIIAARRRAAAAAKAALKGDAAG